MRAICLFIVWTLAITVATTAYAQVVQVAPPVTYVGPTDYVTPGPVYVSPSPTYYRGPTYSYAPRPYVTRYGYAPSYTYRTWWASRPLYYGTMRPVVRYRTYAW